MLKVPNYPAISLVHKNKTLKILTKDLLNKTTRIKPSHLTIPVVATQVTSTIPVPPTLVPKTPVTLPTPLLTTKLLETFPDLMEMLQTRPTELNMTIAITKPALTINKITDLTITTTTTETEVANSTETTKETLTKTPKTEVQKRNQDTSSPKLSRLSSRRQTESENLFHELP